MKEESKKKLKSIPTGKFSRGWKLASLTASIGAQALGSKLNSWIEGSDASSLLLSQINQAKKITETLSQMKGAAMKLGQLLSMHGEHLFPKEVVEILSRLQQHSDSLEFSEIEKIIQAELGARYGLNLKNLSTDAIAAASIGQVHKAQFFKSENSEPVTVAVKIQYPGVEKSIDSDVDSLASLVSVLTKFPNTQGLKSVTEEIKMILKQETDYEKEGENLRLFSNFFKKEESLVFPQFFPEVSSKKVLVTKLVDGLTVEAFRESTASEAARSFLGKKFLELLYRELLELGSVQTDPNFANYKIQWSFGMQEPKLVLLDFGAVKKFSDEFRASYRKMLLACLKDDYEGIRQGALDVGFLKPEDSPELVDLHYKLVKMFMEPFEKPGDYDWSSSDLPHRIRGFMPKFVMGFKLRPPPRDFVFLNRKIMGVYFFSSAIGAKYNPRPILERFVSI